MKEVNSTEDDNKSDSFEEPSSDESDFDFDDESSNQSLVKSQTSQTVSEKSNTFDNKIAEQECESKVIEPAVDEAFIDEPIASSVETYDNYLGDETGKFCKTHPHSIDIKSLTNLIDNFIFISCSDAKARILLRLPSGDRHIFEWPCTTKLKALKLYIPFKYPELTSEPYKVICPFVGGPSNNILDMDDALTLKEANLYPTVILHLRNED